MRVQVPDGALPEDQIVVLKQAEWDKVPVRLQINVATVGEGVIGATMVGVISPAE